MAIVAIRLRRALSLFSSPSLARAFSASPASLRGRSSSVLASRLAFSGLLGYKHVHPPSSLSRCLQARCRTSGSGYSPSDSDGSRPTILFEGCDYEHWLITMEFPTDPKPTREEMIDTFVKTLANVVGSEEEAKRRIYAVCTTTYVGFQARISEELSEKMKGQPGVVWVLPDSYIDPVNKEYGGDKYDNGVITPRPRPPIQQGRYNDRPRNYDRPRFDRRRDSMPIERRDPSPMQGDRMDGRPNFQGERRDYRPVEGRDSMQGERRDYRPMEGRDNMQGERRDYRPMEGRDNMQGERQDYRPVDGRDNIQVERRDYSPMETRDNMRGDQRDYRPVEGRDNVQGEQRDYGPPEQRHSMQGERRDYMPPPPLERRDPVQGERRRNYIPAHERLGTMQVERRDSPRIEERFKMQGEGRDSVQTGQRDPI